MRKNFVVIAIGDARAQKVSFNEKYCAFHSLNVFASYIMFESLLLLNTWYSRDLGLDLLFSVHCSTGLNSHTLSFQGIVSDKLQEYILLSHIRTL